MGQRLGACSPGRVQGRVIDQSGQIDIGVSNQEDLQHALFLG
jgi:hypothetical protein